MNIEMDNDEAQIESTDPRPPTPNLQSDEFRPDPPPPPLERIEVRTPFAVGTVNVYVSLVGPLTLVDTGPNTPEAWADVEAGLARLGHQISEIERIFITHGHVDHWGLVGRLVAASGAAVWAHRSLEPWLRDPAGETTRRLAFSTLLCAELGVPPGEMVAINGGIKWINSFISGPVAPAGLWDDGDTVDLAGHTWEVLYTPGHAITHVCFYQPELRALLSGDHLLGTITSNPLIEAPLPGHSARPRTLPDYMAGLERVAALRVLWVYPGHGAPFGGHRKLIKDRLVFHDRRAAKLLGFLADGPASVYDLSRRLFPTLTGVDLFLGLSETLGHLDLLEDRRQVTVQASGRVWQYAGVSG